MSDDFAGCDILRAVRWRQVGPPILFGEDTRPSQIESYHHHTLFCCRLPFSKNGDVEEM